MDDEALRKRGRPAKKGPEVGRQGLIDAARAVLAQVEPGRVTRLMVAEQAGVDPNLIRYYFGNMRHLIGEVIADTHRTARRDMWARRTVDGPLERLHYRMERTFHMFGDNPHHLSLVADTLYENPRSDENEEWVAIMTGTLQDLEGIVDLGVSQGVMRRVDTRQLHYLIISVSVFYASNKPALRMLFGDDVDAESFQRASIDFLYDIVMRGLAPEP